MVATALRTLLAVVGEGGFMTAIGFVGVRVGWTVLRATNGMCVVGDESISYHAKAPVTGGYKCRVC